MNKISNKIYNALQEYPRKRISLEELSALCSEPDKLSEYITELTEQGVLVPVKSSGTNGNQKKPLFLRYTICIRDNVQIPPDEIYSLHPKLQSWNRSLILRFTE